MRLVQGLAFERVVRARCGAVDIHMVNLSRLDTRDGQSVLDQSGQTVGIGVKLRLMIGVGSERATRRVFQRRDRGIGLAAGVDQVFGQSADDAVSSGVDFTNFFRMLARGL